MTTKKKYILGLLALIVIMFFTYFMTNRHSENEIMVTVDNKLNIDKVKIQFGFFNSNSGNDFSLTQNGLSKTVYNCGDKKDFETICGENDFYLTYDNKYYTVLRHFIPNDFVTGLPQPHKYYFNLVRDNADIILKLEIVGPDGEEREKKLLTIESSKENFWGSEKHLKNDD
jgi:hypothetical protein